MKILIIILISGILFSCTKESNSSRISSEPYIGMYNSQNGDTATVYSGSNGMVKIRYAAKNVLALRTTFDSIRVNADNSFTCNEFITRENPGFTKVEPAIGAGYFNSSGIYFNIAINGTSFSFTGVKK